MNLDKIKIIAGIIVNNKIKPNTIVNPFELEAQVILFLSLSLIILLCPLIFEFV